ncbi:MAG: hypothetical protein KQ78_01494 [Candidatus Izimaplasma bacterium HR2]|nr:MAG: hypothetical protein KQ78_01494 [Candidatus Izimaplasma bacterium HR2]
MAFETPEQWEAEARVKGRQRSESARTPGSMPVLSARSLVKTYPDCPLSVPMSVLNETPAKANHSQTLKRLAERGGLEPTEILANIECRDWRRMDMAQAIDRLNKLIA